VNDTAYDVVCHMDVDEDGAIWTSEYRGRTFYFCHQSCKELFDRDPGMFVD